MALLLSALVHLGGYAVLRWSSTMPQVDFELTLPSEVEFGLTEAAAVEAPPPPPAEPPQAAATTPTAVPTGDEPKPKRKPKPDPSDAGVDGGADAGEPALVADKDEDKTRERPDAALPGGDAKGPLLAQFAPKGAQIALRVHMGRVRDSKLAEDVRRLLDAVPDWRLVLGGSGIDPLRDLERLYLATPDLRRSNLVIAGEYVGSAELPRAAVASLAAARGREVSWSKRSGIFVAPWLNEDETERVVALIAPRQFAITRPDDLPRVLLVARALAARRREQAKQPVNENENAREQEGDALLALGERESFAVAIEGARMFARGNTRGVPERLELAVSLEENGEYAVHAVGHFESAEASERARDYWQRVRDQFEANPLVALIGMRQPLTRSELSANESEIAFDTRVTVPQARVLLGFLSQRLGGAPRAPRAGAPTDPAPALRGGASTEPAPRERLSPRGP